MWKENNVKTSKLGRISFNDLCEHILKIFPNEKICDVLEDDQKIYINNNLYVSDDAAKIIIINHNNRAAVIFTAKYFYENIPKNIGVCCVFKQRFLKYQDTEIMYFKIENIKWYKARNITCILKYSNHKAAIRNLICNKNKICFEKLKYNQRDYTSLLIRKYFVDPKTIFINDNGLNELLAKSEKTSIYSNG